MYLQSNQTTLQFICISLVVKEYLLIPVDNTESTSFNREEKSNINSELKSANTKPDIKSELKVKSISKIKS